MSQKDSESQSALTSIIVNVLLPVLILSYMSEGAIDITLRPEQRDWWDLGPLWAMVLALILPFAYGLYALIKQKKVELMSAVGLISVILTGTVTFFVVRPDGSLYGATPWLFGVKEALIPISLAIVILVSHQTKTPLLRTFVYTQDVFDILSIEKAVVAQGTHQGYEKLLWSSSWILALAFVVSSMGNFFLSVYFLEPVLSLPEQGQQVAYNQAVGKITWWGFLIIGVPMMVAVCCIVLRLVTRLKSLTGLTADKIMMAKF